MEIINKFINANGKIMKKEKLKVVTKVYIIFMILMLCLLPFVGGIIGISGLIIVPVFCVLACLYNNKVIKKPSTFKNVYIAYILIFEYLFLMFNLMLYSFPKLMGLNLDMIVLFIIVFEIICIILGCFYTYLSIKKNKIKEYKEPTALTISVIASLSGCWTIFVRRFVNSTSITTQAFIYIVAVSIGCCVYAFYIGKIFIPMYYFIKKYNIDEFDFLNE